MQHVRKGKSSWRWVRLLAFGVFVGIVGCSGGGDADVPRLPSAQPAMVALEPGAHAVVALQDGYPPYRVISQDPAAVEVTLQDRSAARVRATNDAKAGAYRVSVIDSRGGTGAFTVNVSIAPLRVLSPTPLILTLGGSAEVEIRGGVPPYRVVSDRIDLVQTSVVEGNRLRLQARNAVGSASVNVADSSGANMLLSVQIRTLLPLTIQPTALVLPVGTSNVLQIQGGQPPYSATVSNPGALSVRAENSTVSLMGLATADDITVTVIDNVGQTVQSIVSVRPMTRELGLSPGRVEISEANNQTIRFTFVGMPPVGPIQVLSSQHRLLLPVSDSLSTAGFVIAMQGTGACVEQDESVTITAIDNAGAMVTATVVVKNIANQYDSEGNLISRCPPDAL